MVNSLMIVTGKSCELKKVSIPENLSTHTYFQKVVDAFLGAKDSNNIHSIWLMTESSVCAWYKKAFKTHTKIVYSSIEQYEKNIGLFFPVLFDILKTFNTDSFKTASVYYEPEHDLVNKYPELYNILPLDDEKSCKRWLDFIINTLNVNYHPDDEFKNYLKDGVLENGNITDINGDLTEITIFTINWIDGITDIAMDICGDKLYEYGFEILDARLESGKVGNKENIDKTVSDILDSGLSFTEDSNKLNLGNLSEKRKREIDTITSCFWFLHIVYLENEEFQEYVNNKYPFKSSIDEIFLIPYNEFYLNMFIDETQSLDELGVEDLQEAFMDVIAQTVTAINSILGDLKMTNLLGEFLNQNAFAGVNQSPVTSVQETRDWLNYIYTFKFDGIDTNVILNSEEFSNILDSDENNPPYIVMTKQLTDYVDLRVKNGDSLTEIGKYIFLYLYSRQDYSILKTIKDSTWIKKQVEKLSIEYMNLKMNPSTSEFSGNMGFTKQQQNAFDTVHSFFNFLVRLYGENDEFQEYMDSNYPFQCSLDEVFDLFNDVTLNTHMFEWVFDTSDDELQIEFFNIVDKTVIALNFILDNPNMTKILGDIMEDGFKGLDYLPIVAVQKTKAWVNNHIYMFKFDGTNNIGIKTEKPLNEKFTVDHFVRGDEVYLVNGTGKPFGIIEKLGTTNIYVIPHNKPGRAVVKKPTELYLGKEWHLFNKKPIEKQNLTEEQVKSITQFVSRNSWFDYEGYEEADDTLQFATKRNGIVNDDVETHGEADAEMAKKLKTILLQEFNFIDVEIEYVEEYVMMFIKSKKVINLNESASEPKQKVVDFKETEEYQKYFRDKLEEYGFVTVTEMDKETKSKFFSDIEKEWKEKK